MALTENINYLQPTGFRIVVDRRRFGNFTFFAQNVSLPELSTAAAESSFRQYASVPQIPDTFNYGELSMNIIIDEDMNSYTEMLNWIKQNVTNEVNDTMDENSSYADLTVTILSSKNNLNKKMIYRDCFPTVVGSFTMETNISGTTPVVVFPVSFRYTYFDIE